MTDWLNHLRSLRQEGYADAQAGRPMRHGCLASREERLEYCKGFEDWQEEACPSYTRWTHRESGWQTPLKLEVTAASPRYASPSGESTESREPEGQHR